MACASRPDESRLYIADTGRMHEDHWAREIRVFDVLDSDAGRLSEPRFFYKPDVGVADGFRADEHGNIWTSAGDGVHCVTPEGEPIGKLRVPQTVSNVVFGGRARSAAVHLRHARGVRDLPQHAWRGPALTR